MVSVVGTMVAGIYYELCISYATERFVELITPCRRISSEFMAIFVDVAVPARLTANK